MISSLTHELFRSVWFQIFGIFLNILLLLISNFNLQLEHTLWFNPWKYIVLWISILSILVTVSHAFEKKVYSAVRCNVIYVSIISRRLIVIQIFYVFTDYQFFFCLVGLLIAKIWVLKSPTVIVESFFPPLFQLSFGIFRFYY